ncbi:MAG: hypothetical protein CBC38_01585 [Gammaproteobacteria bacterium TMED78]|nr:MAG: hypothetical protein CBC38_01585 [Gammaproteobacteria bacterium TMED78]|tara:strand:+ start:815 stop:1240 length:426 start_codon:yes stop_codon:yes gene_type:complete
MKVLLGFFSTFLVISIIFNTISFLKKPTTEQQMDFKIVNVTELNKINQASEENNLLLDVRTKEEFNLGHIPNAINISHDLLLTNINLLSDHKKKNIYVYCRSGPRAGLVINELLNNGFNNIIDVEGDFLSWVNAELPIEKN